MKQNKKMASKPLALSRETVRDLQSHELTLVAGGNYIPFSRQLGCTTSCPQ